MDLPPNAAQCRVAFENALKEDVKKFEKDLQTVYDFTQTSFGMITQSLTNLHSQATQLGSAIGALTREAPQPPDESHPVGSPEITEVAAPENRPPVPVIDLEDESPGNKRKRRKVVPGKNAKAGSSCLKSRNDRTGPAANAIIQPEMLPSTSCAASCSYRKPDEEDDDDIDTEAVRIALRRTKGGVLSDPDFLSFIKICRKTDDPFRLAETFSVDFQRLKEQLLTFSFYITLLHEDIIEREGRISAKDRRIRDRVLRIIDAIQEGQHSRRRLNIN